MRDHAPHAEQAAHLVDIDHPHVVLEGDLRDRRHVNDAGVVQQYVDPTKTVQRLRDEARPAVLLAHVVVEVDRDVSQRRGDGLAGVVEDVAEHDLGPFRREEPGRRLALTARRAGDE